MENTDILVIPADVMEIAPGAYAFNKTIKKVSILGAAKIGREAFMGCDNLEEVYLADGVQSLGDECFAFCSKIHEIFIPKSVEYIGCDIACMNDADDRYPIFLCERRAIGKNWHDEWNRIYHDIRFGSDRKHMFYHQTYYGSTRKGDEQKAEKRAPLKLVTDVPHTTARLIELPTNPPEHVRIPATKLRLWLKATRITLMKDKEFELDEEIREIVPRLIRSNDADKSIERKLDEPWEITIDNSVWLLAPELAINAWINIRKYPFDGKTLVVNLDAPDRGTYDDAWACELSMGETVIAEKIFKNGNFMDLIDVRLFIEWPKQEYTKYTIEQVFDMLRQRQKEWSALKDGENEVSVFLAHGSKQFDLFKHYQPSTFPAQFIADLSERKAEWTEIEEIIVQPCKLYYETHDYSDDYKCAAGISDDDDTSWTETKRKPIGQRLNFEIQH